MPEAQKPCWLSREQTKYLRERVDRVTYPLINAARQSAKLKEPAAVTKARALVEAFDAKAMAQRDAAEEAVRQRIRKILNAVLFYPDEETLRAVEALEKEVKDA